MSIEKLEKLKEIVKELKILANEVYSNENYSEEVCEELDEATLHVKRAMAEINKEWTYYLFRVECPSR